MQQLITWLNEHDIGDLLDIGTGSGAFLRFCLKHAKSYQSAVGIDAVETVLEEARKTTAYGNVTYLTAQAEKLPFADGEFTTVSMSNALHHFRSPLKSLKQMKRVLQPGGTLVMAEVHAELTDAKQLTHAMMHSLKVDADKLCGQIHHDPFTTVDIIDMVKASGFQVECNFIANLADSSPDEDTAYAYAESERAVNAIVARLCLHPELTEFKTRRNQILSRAKEIGVARPDQLIVIAHNPAS